MAGHSPCRFAGTWVSFYLQVCPADLHPVQVPAECGNAIEGLHGSKYESIAVTGTDLHGLGYLVGSYTAFGSCSCWITSRIRSISGSGATLRLVSGFCRTSSANGRGNIHIPGGNFCVLCSSFFSAPAIIAARTGAAFFREINQPSAILLCFKSIWWRAEKTRVEPT